MERQGKIVWRYGVRCLGVKNRCRKTEWHYTDKGEVGETDNPTELEAKTLAQVWINQNMKTTSQKVARATRWLVQDGGIEYWEPFTKEHNLEWKM